MEFKGSQTEKNMRAALAGESIARNKYTYFGEKARKEGNIELAEMFERMALNESTHAKIWYTSLFGAIQESAKNLQNAASGEFEEWSHMYPDFAKTAREEGFEQQALMFEKIAEIEKNHEKQFMEAIIKLTKKPSATSEEAKPADIAPEKDGYRCMFCGATFEHRPDVCPVCEAIGSFEDCKIRK